MSGKSLGHHLFEFHGLLGRIDLDQRFLGDSDLDTVAAFHCPQHLELLVRRRLCSTSEQHGYRLFAEHRADEANRAQPVLRRNVRFLTRQNRKLPAFAEPLKQMIADNLRLSLTR